MSGSAVSLIRPGTPPVVITPRVIVSVEPSLSTRQVVGLNAGVAAAVTLGKCDARNVGAIVDLLVVNGGGNVFINTSGDFYIGGIAPAGDQAIVHAEGDVTQMTLSDVSAGSIITLTVISSTQWMVKGDVTTTAVTFGNP